MQACTFPEGNIRQSPSLFKTINFTIMKKVNYLWICVLSILLVCLNSNLKSQTTYDPLFGHHCVEDLSQYLISSKMSSKTFGGKYKP